MAVSTAAQVFALIAPTLSARSDSADYLALSVRQHTPATNWGDIYPELIAYHCAHMMSMALGEQASLAAGFYGAPGGEVTSQRAGDLAVSFAQAPARGSISAEDAEYLRTTYGRRYLSLRNSRARIGAGVVVVDPSAGVASS